jgi:hypothetical protein
MFRFFYLSLSRLEKQESDEGEKERAVENGDLIEGFTGGLDLIIARVLAAIIWPWLRPNSE